MTRAATEARAKTSSSRRAQCHNPFVCQRKDLVNKPSQAAKIDRSHHPNSFISSSFYLFNSLSGERALCSFKRSHAFIFLLIRSGMSIHFARTFHCHPLVTKWLLNDCCLFHFVPWAKATGQENNQEYSLSTFQVLRGNFDLG